MWPPLPRNYLPLSYENMNKLSKATTTNTEALLLNAFGQLTCKYNKILLNLAESCRVLQNVAVS